MNLSEMITLVRTDLKDETVPYRWSDGELEKHIIHALNDFSEALPVQEKATIETIAGSREISLSSLSDLVVLEAVEYPSGKFPRQFQSYSFWADIVTLNSGEIPDGAGACVYYGKLHTLDASASTIPERHEDLLAAGAAGYAALEWAAFTINKVNVGGNSTSEKFLALGNEKLDYFKHALKKLGRINKLHMRRLYTV